MYKKIDFDTRDELALDILEDRDLMKDLHRAASKLAWNAHRAKQNDNRAVEIVSTDVVESIYALLDLLVMQADNETAEG